jgi:hypothetical protein
LECGVSYATDIVLADSLSPARIETPEQGAQFVKVFRAAVEAARAVGADRSVTNKYAEKMVRSVRITGKLIEPMLPGRGARTDLTSETDFRSFCKEAAVTDRTARNWQLVAAIPEPEFEARLAELRDAPDPNSVITLSPFYGIHNHRARGTGKSTRIDTKLHDHVGADDGGGDDHRDDEVGDNREMRVALLEKEQIAALLLAWTEASPNVREQFLAVKSMEIAAISRAWKAAA